jgi:hypothetical protein
MLTPATQALDPQQRSSIQSELRPGERIVWASAALPRWLMAASIAPAIFAIPWTAFAVFWTVMAYRGTRDVDGPFAYLFPLWGVPFILIGLGMFTSPYWVARRLRRTTYAITNERAIVVSPGWFGSKKVRSFGPESLASVERFERADGSGDLVFEQYTRRRGSSSHTVRNGFISVPRVREVEDLLRKTLTARMNAAAAAGSGAAQRP